MEAYCRTFSLSRPFLAPHKPRVRRSTAISASSPARGSRSVFETRLSLVLSLASQASTLTQRRLGELAEETAKYVFPRRFESKSLEESLMSVPDLETVKYRVLKRTELYEIREVEPYFIAETKMPGKTGFDFNGASESFNTLASYLFGKNIANEQMEMTTPVYTTKIDSNNGEKMNMTTPVITKKDKEKWLMAFVVPSKYGSNIPLPKDKSVIIKKVPQKIIATCAFSGFVTDEDVSRRESKLRQALKTDPDCKLKDGTLLEVAQFNPPFTLPFTRRNEISLEVEMTNE